MSITMWFRGQADESWALLPSVYRKRYEKADEDSYRHEFQLRAYPHLSEATYAPTNLWEWYFLMQHYGVPTRLLDWTESSLVGLFFALFDPDERCDSKDGTVWILDPWYLNESVANLGDVLPRYSARMLSRYIWPIWGRRNLPAGVAAFEPPANSKRLAAQRGKFTVHGKARLALETYPSLLQGLVRIVVPASAKPRVKRQLTAAGITEGVIFPDLSGLGREIRFAWTDEDPL
jgi:hypothetical protein